MKAIYYFLMFLTFSFFVSCSYISNKSTATLENYFIEFDSIPIPVLNLTNLTEVRIPKYSDIYESVKLVKLEMSEQSLVGRISNVTMLPNGNLLIFDKENKKILLFSDEGKFLNKIGEQGKGNTEYMFPYPPVYDQYTDEIVVWDHAKQVFMFYNIDGEYLRNVSFPLWFGAFSILDSDHFVIYMNFDDNDTSQKDFGYNILIVSKNGEIVQKGLEYNHEAVPLKHVCENVFPMGSEKVFCNPMLSSIIFEVSKDTISPSYVLDFGNDAIPNEWYGKYDAVDIHNMINKKKNTCYCNFFGETCNSYVMNIIRNGLIYLCVLPKNSENDIVFSSILINDFFGEASNVEVYSIYKNKVLSVLYSENFLEAKEQIAKYPDPKERKKICLDFFDENLRNGDNQVSTTLLRECFTSVSFEHTEEELDFINSFDGSENPVIQIATLK